MSKRSFGSIRQRASGRWQARYIGPDGRQYTARTEDGRALTFERESYAEKWLTRVDADIQTGRWVSPDAAKPKAAPAVTLREYTATWLAGRELSGFHPAPVRGSHSISRCSPRSVTRPSPR